MQNLPTSRGIHQKGVYPSRKTRVLLGFDHNFQNNRIQLGGVALKDRCDNRPGTSGFLRYDHLDRGAIRVFKPLSAIVLERLFKRCAHRHTVLIPPMNDNKGSGPTSPLRKTNVLILTKGRS